MTNTPPNPQGQQPPQPPVAIVAVNPGTAGCMSAVFAAIGLPLLAYIMPGKILRGLTMQVVYFAFLGAAFFIPLLVAGKAAEGAKTQDENLASGLIGLVGAPMMMGIVWFAWIIFTMADVSKLVREHNSGKGISYT